MNQRRIILWAGGAFVVVMLGVWFLSQDPEELDAWVHEESAAPLPPPPKPAPVPKRSGPCRGLTSTLLSQEKFVAKVGSVVDTPCAAVLSVLCVKGGELRASAPVSGHLLISREVADSMCGAPWRMVSSGVFQGQGELPSQVRFWVAGDGQFNPWD
ncbi:MAG: hypothetical protein Q8K32_02025 [Archangium sp.]|nr:hypothetical protein [Archangium sp.]